MDPYPPQLVRYLGRVNLSLNADYCIEHHILQTGIWEPFVVQMFDLLVDAGDTCVDIGANTGVHSLLLARCVGEQGSVVSFEPSPDYSARFLAQVGLNPDLSERITLHKSGLSDVPGTLKLFEAGNIAGNAYLAENYDEALWNRFGPDKYVDCQVTTLDAVLLNSRVDLIKIDVEGMESKVASGARGIIAAHAPYLVYETLVACFPAEKLLAMQRVVFDAGYSTFFIHPKLNKLVQCQYPFMPGDVVAIHPRRMLKLVPNFLNRAIFLFDGASTTTLFGGPMQLSVVGVGEKDFCVAFHPLDDDSIQMQRVVTESGEIVFHQMTAMGATTFRAPIVQYGDGKIGTYQNTVVFGYTDGERYIDEGRLVDGGLYLHGYRNAE